MINRFLKNIGPGPLIAAAFVGPGTVTLCMIAGVHFGFALLWVMLIAVFTAIILQEMSARLGLVAQRGLSEVIREQLTHPFLRVLAVVLILSAIVIGNAAYEAGNISGSVLGVQTVINDPIVSIAGFSINYLGIVIGLLAFILLFIGNYKVLERALIVLVLVMSISFVVTAVMTRPDLSELLTGMLRPSFPKNSALMMIGLIGTTVVPYNLFLHAAVVREKWASPDKLGSARRDTIVAIAVGGGISMAIIVSAAAVGQGAVNNIADLAKALEPLFGSFSTYFLAIGMFSAGITSAITAPLAAAYVAKGCFGWQTGLKSWRFRSVWMIILLLGVVLASLDIKPIEIIKFAQVTNGILLPIIASFLLWAMNNKSVLGNYRNNWKQNISGFFVLLVALVLGAKSILKVLGVF